MDSGAGRAIQGFFMQDVFFLIIGPLALVFIDMDAM
jgi:hypothetical protein